MPRKKGFKCSKETKEKMSKAKKGKHYPKMSEAHKRNNYGFQKGNKFGIKFQKGSLVGFEHRFKFKKDKKPILKCGYKLIYKPKHPYCEKNGYVREHRLVMEKKVKRYLLKSETVHHINSNKSDNRIENLQLVSVQNHGSEVKCPFCNKTYLIKIS